MLLRRAMHCTNFAVCTYESLSSFWHCSLDSWSICCNLPCIGINKMM